MFLIMHCINLWAIHEPLFQRYNNSLLLFSLATEENLSSPVVFSCSTLQLLCEICGSLALALFAQEPMNHYRLWGVKWALVIQSLENVSSLYGLLSVISVEGF